ncbi:MAG: GHMP kinase, partial [Candidatus Aminicenantes bacterium RBG_13_62_12]
ILLDESPDLRIEPSAQDAEVYRDDLEFVERLNLYGYYGGTRLIKAAVKTFFEHCRSRNIPTQPKNFMLRYDSDIPRQVGLGGSSAIIVAAMRALMAFHGVTIPDEVLPTLVLRAELKELGINAGYMDRVIQVYEGCVYMDLSRHLIEERGFGKYERLNPGLLPPFYLAYKPDLGKVSGAVHSELRTAYDRGDPTAIQTLQEIAGLAEEGRKSYGRGDFSRWPDLMNRNFDLRSRVMRISPSNMEMIQTARRCGASANFAGSGGSLVGYCEDETMFERLSEELGRLGAKVIRPQVV